MDTRLIGWARAVKRRTRAPHAVLWLFAEIGGPDPLAFARAAPHSPRLLCGVVLRPVWLRGLAEPDRARFARRLARLCRERGLELTVAGDWRLARALGAGLHLRDGRRPPHAPRGWKLLTSSAHDGRSLRRARAVGALAFLSPAFPTTSHPGAPALGPLRWSRLAGHGCGAVGCGAVGCGALGGITGRSVRRLPRAAAAGAIGALSLRATK